MPPGAAPDPFKADFIVKLEVGFRSFFKYSECIGASLPLRGRQNGQFKSFEDLAKPLPAKTPKYTRKASKIDWPGHARSSGGVYPGTNLRDHFYVRYDGFME